MQIEETGEESEVSHYSHDSQGQVKRVMVKRREAAPQDIQRAKLKSKKFAQMADYIQNTPRDSMDQAAREGLFEIEGNLITDRKLQKNQSNFYSVQDEEKGNNNITSRRNLKNNKNSMYLEDGTIGSGSDTLNDKRLLDNIGLGAEYDMHKIRCETPPEFVESGVGYQGFINGIKLQHQS